jgi:mitochondrial fission protein ELM1
MGCHRGANRYRKPMFGHCRSFGSCPYCQKSGVTPALEIPIPLLGFECSSTFSEPLNPPWPDILITSGRKSIAVSRYIKKKSQGKTFTVHIQDPRINPKQFDMVAVPQHDPTRGENVFVTIATPNKITDEKLALAKDEFAHLFDKINSPRIAVLIGGSTKRYHFKLDDTKTLVQKLLP